jgi:hypothetical protein
MYQTSRRGVLGSTTSTPPVQMIHTQLQIWDLLSCLSNQMWEIRNSRGIGSHKLVKHISKQDSCRQGHHKGLPLCMLGEAPEACPQS